MIHIKRIHIGVGGGAQARPRARNYLREGGGWPRRSVLCQSARNPCFAAGNPGFPAGDRAAGRQPGPESHPSVPIPAFPSTSAPDASIASGIADFASVPAPGRRFQEIVTLLAV